MTREKFIEILKKGNYTYSQVEDRLIITDYTGLDLEIKSLPSNVEFSGSSYVYLDSLESLPPNIKFKNGGSVSLHSLRSIPTGFTFENGRGVWLDSFGIDTKDGEEENNVLNIEGINPKRILNQMISIGLLDR